MKQTAVFGLETIRQINPKDIKNLKELGNAYLEVGDTEKTIAIGNEIQKIKPKRRRCRRLNEACFCRRGYE